MLFSPDFFIKLAMPVSQVLKYFAKKLAIRNNKT